MSVREWLSLALILSALVYISIPILKVGWYISDEQWYVSAARNILHDVFKTPAFSPYYTAPPECLTPWSHVVKTYSRVDAVTVEGYVTCYVRRGYWYPDEPGILTYYNFEHPPLAKYVIALALAIHDEPWFWRMPSLALGVATVALVYLTARRLYSPLPAALAAWLMLWDTSFRFASRVAMLEVYVAFFTALSAYLYLTGRTAASAVALGLATSAKFTGAFPAFAVFWLERRRMYAAVLYATIAFIVFYVVNLPMVAWMGQERWVSELLSALRWHTTSRPPGPTASNPLDWLLMQNCFTADICGTPVYAVALAWALWRRSAPSALYLSAYGGYWLVYLLGNHTLYTFYTASFSPLAHLVAAEMMYALSRRF